MLKQAAKPRGSEMQKVRRGWVNVTSTSLNMKLTYFNHTKRRAYRSEPVSTPGPHTTGGSASTLVRNSLSVPFDLLFSLDLSDPAVDLDIPLDDQGLPLVYGLDYVGHHGDQRYSINSDGTVDVAEADEFQPDGEHVPTNAEPQAMQLVDCQFDLSKAEDALSMLQVFGLSDLSEQELERALEIAYSSRYPLEVYEDWQVYKDSTKREYLEFWGSKPFWQPGGVSAFCSNNTCNGQNACVFAACDTGRLLVIFRYCPDCQSILTQNQA